MQPRRSTPWIMMKRALPTRRILSDRCRSLSLMPHLTLLNIGPLRLHRLGRQHLGRHVDLLACDDLRRAPERAIVQFGIPAAQLNAADNLVFRSEEHTSELQSL